jgi:hypothetical protein
MFNIFIQPIVTVINSHVTFGSLISKYGVLFLFLVILFLHSSNSKKLKFFVIVKGALLSVSLLWVLDYLIFGILATKHSFFGSENHGNTLGVIFLFPFWIYLAWNIIFVGLEYIATYSRLSVKKFPFVYKQYIHLSILEALYKKKQLHSDYIIKKFGIDYRYFQMEVLHRFILDELVIYDRKNDTIYGYENWENKKIFSYFEPSQLLIPIEYSSLAGFIQSLNEQQKKSIKFKDFFELNEKLDQEEIAETVWDKFKNLIFPK